MAGQQRLFEHYNPLEQRVGKSFFDELPKVTGVYKMYGRNGKLLYVGKAKNLRNRLFTYRRAKMGTIRRKIIRLIRMTHDIAIEICESEKEALLLENKLIRKHQPEFNHAKKQPETYYYVGLERKKEILDFSLQMHIPDRAFVFGAFRGHRLVRKTMGGIIRTLYILENEVETVFGMPSVLTQKLTPMQYGLSLGTLGEEIWMPLLNFYEGKNRELMDLIILKCEQNGLLQSFAGSVILDDLESMKWFYERCSRRNFQIRRQLDLDSRLIPQQKLDDYLIEWAFAGE